jgi:hypothetical protein
MTAQYTALLNNVYKLETPKIICPRPNKNCAIWWFIINTLTMREVYILQFNLGLYTYTHTIYIIFRSYFSSNNRILPFFEIQILDAPAAPDGAPLRRINYRK